MQADYFSKSFELLGLTPAVSQRDLALALLFTSRYGLKLPMALRYWYSLENHYDLLQAIVGSNSPIEPDEAHKFSPYLPIGSDEVPWLPILSENQGVYHLAVRLDEGDDPPVYGCYAEPDELWKPHARSFSEWIYALAWDHSIDGQWERYLWHVTEEQVSKHLASADEIGPETRLFHLWFRAERFVRVTLQGQRYTLPIGLPSERV